MNIEKLIRENRDMFDEKEPFPGHLQRFGKKLENRPTLPRFYMIRALAALLAGIILITGGYMYFSRQNENPAISGLPEEVQETLYYYDGLTGNMIREIRQLPVGDEMTKKKMLKDIQGNDNDYKRLMSDLRKYPGDERVIHALIEYHRSRAEMIGYILGRIENINDIKQQLQSL